MPGIDEFLLFRPLKFAILSTSDACTAESDESADCLASRIQDAGHSLSDRISVKEDVTIVSDTVKGWTKSDDVDVILVSGGTVIEGGSGCYSRGSISIVRKDP